MSRKLFGGFVIFACLALCAFAEDRSNQGGKKGGPKVGDPAPDFTATVLGEDEEVKLSEVLKTQKKPVVLIFGSST